MHVIVWLFIYIFTCALERMFALFSTFALYAYVSYAFLHTFWGYPCTVCVYSFQHMTIPMCARVHLHVYTCVWFVSEFWVVLISCILSENLLNCARVLEHTCIRLRHYMLCSYSSAHALCIFYHCYHAYIYMLIVDAAHFFL